MCNQHIQPFTAAEALAAMNLSFSATAHTLICGLEGLPPSTDPITIGEMVQLHPNVAKRIDLRSKCYTAEPIKVNGLRIFAWAEAHARPWETASIYSQADPQSHTRPVNLAAILHNLRQHPQLAQLQLILRCTTSQRRAAA